MTFSGVCDDSGNLRGDTDEQAAERVIILWYHSHLIPSDVGHVSAVIPHFSSFWQALRNKIKWQEMLIHAEIKRNIKWC